jgi:hypothetical protein
VLLKVYPLSIVGGRETLKKKENPAAGGRSPLDRNTSLPKWKRSVSV